ncbi:MAG TPA: DJ-1/PfpI family protein [Thermoanaerobaculia bacterium]|nr:DJ-1/PfpI family protein [Thermoanaerobaculia bacterium]
MRRSRTILLQTLAVPVLLAALLGAGCRASEPEEDAASTAAAPSPPAPQAPAQPAPPPSPAPDNTDLGTDFAPPPEGTAPAPAPGPASGRGPAADLPRDRPLRAAFLVVDGVYNTELAAPYDVFQHTTYHSKPGMQVFTVSPDGQPVTTFEGIRITPHHSFANAPAADILVIPSTRGSMDRDLQNRALIDWVRRTAGQARHVVSLCDGAFVLAQAGLLDGVPATTFPEDYDRLVKMFPKVDLRVNVSFVDAGKILTSQGGARSYDVAMHLVDKLYGTQTAEGIGKGLLIPWPPDPDTMEPRAVEPVRPGQGAAPAGPATPGPATPGPMEPVRN